MCCGDITFSKRKDIKIIQECLNSFNKNIRFTIDNFPDGNIRFVDIEIEKNHTSIFYKPTHTGQYQHTFS